MQLLEIQEKEAGQRLDKYLKKLLCQAPSGFIYKMLRKKNILLNDKKADGSKKIQVGDKIKLFLAEETIAKFTVPERDESDLKRQYPCIPLEVVYEDRDILVINKPAGMLSQKSAPSDMSANEYIVGYLLNTGAMTGQELKTFTPSICNRLDRNTSGLLLVGKTLKGLQDMAKRLRERDLKKYYQCLVKGVVAEAAEIRGWLWKDEKTNQVTVTSGEEDSGRAGSYIRTAYRPIRQYGAYTLLQVHLITGRFHQIRAHLAFIGHPIVGDGKYGDRNVNRRFREKCGLTGQLLHAWRMEFPDGLKLEAPLPGHFQAALEALEKEAIV